MNEMMTVLVLGATGATARLLVQQLLDHGLRVKAIVRSPDNLPDSLRQHECLSIIRASVLDLSDNEKAADYLRTEVGQNDTEIQWSAVRPDSLFEEDEVSDYELHPSPTRSAIFNPARTSRINVAHFMADLITNHDAWEQWKGQMPVIYNKQ